VKCFVENVGAASLPLPLLLRLRVPRPPPPPPPPPPPLPSRGDVGAADALESSLSNVSSIRSRMRESRVICDNSEPQLPLFPTPAAAAAAAATADADCGKLY
jgi:hypothetical protein